MKKLITRVQNCTLCSDHLPQGVRPVLQADSQARILIAGQAPGRKVHASGIPFDDASGDRLRKWMGIERETFYDARVVALLPMGFCYPGSGKSGDLPPRKECVATWHRQLLDELTNIQLTLVIGQYALKYHLPEAKGNLTEIVRAYQTTRSSIIPLPHPSPRNNIWFKKNPWFVSEIIPRLQERICTIISPVP